MPRTLAAITLLALAVWPALAASTDFSTPAALTRHGDGPGPSLEGGVLQLLHGETGESNVVAFERTAPGLYGRVRAQFNLTIAEGADGGAFALLSTDAFGTTGAPPNLGAWEEPSLPGSFAVGVDVYNPPGGDPFDDRGNIEDRPQREVSLHWDGIEVANAMSPVEFRGEAPHRWVVDVAFVPGGAEVTVTVDGESVYDNAFIAGMAPYESRVLLAGRTGGLTTTMALSDLSVEWSEPTELHPAPIRVTAIDGAVLHAGNREPTFETALPEPDTPVARVVLTLTLDAPPGGFDPWDRAGAIYAWDDAGQRVELARFMTPFGRGWTWHVDVTDFLPLLRGPTKMGLYIDTWMGAASPEEQKGWKVTVGLDYYPGECARTPFEVRTLWSGQPEYGNPEKPLDRFFETRAVPVPKGATGAKLRFMVTGHGMHPATGNAAEFMPADRTVTCNGAAFANRLWKNDVYLNPCRPQGGTWKYSRAGWGPGDVCDPWEIDVSWLVKPGGTLRIDYVPMPYVNEARAEARASHLVEAQVVFCR